MAQVNYAASVRFKDYACGGCGKRRVKLWRLYNVTFVHQILHCVVCASRREGVDYRTVNGLGVRRATGYGVTCDTNHIGEMVPAIPSDVENGKIDNYWGCLAVPQAGWEWWRALPLT